MRSLKIILALSSIALAVFTFSIAFYPFFQIGFSILSEQYPNSKAYIMAAELDQTGMPSDFYIVGMDFTTHSMLVLQMPSNLTIEGKTLFQFYLKGGISRVQKKIGKLLKIKFTDYFIFTSKSSSLFLDTLSKKVPQLQKQFTEGNEFEKGYRVRKAISMISRVEPLNALTLFPIFKKLFKTSIGVAKFMRVANFFSKKPRVDTALLPTVNENGILRIDKDALNDLHIELQNCNIVVRPTMLKFTLIKNSNISSQIFSYSTWNKWTQHGFNVRIIPVVCSYSLRGRNVVFEVRKGDWQDKVVEEILKEIYPNRRFEFLKLDNLQNLKYYYEVEENSALYRYYEVGNSDFIILIGK